MEKIQEKMLRAEAIKQEREEIMDQRAIMKKQIEVEKREMMEKIEKVKLGKMRP
jgi:hypothetical protein